MSFSMNAKWLVLIGPELHGLDWSSQYASSSVSALSMIRHFSACT
jgi:hypothetical protein